MTMTIKNNFDNLNMIGAVALFKKGREEWNKWVEHNPQYNIDFSGVNCHMLGVEKGILDFSDFRFPSGYIDFTKADFGRLHVKFVNAKFGGGYVFFQSIEVKGSIDFENTDFGDSFVSFVDTKFGKGGCRFAKTEFGNKDIFFINTTFECERVDFSKAIFGDGDIHFISSKFRADSVDFSGIKVKGRFLMIECETKLCRSFLFTGALFGDQVSIVGLNFTCVPNFTSTRIPNQLDLQHISVKHKRTKKVLRILKTGTSDDIGSLRKLKEIAENNKHHDKALEFHALEMRASRWHDWQNIPQDIIDIAYDAISNYGRSEWRPAALLALTWYGFAKLFYNESVKSMTPDSETWGNALVFSAGQLLPIIPGSRLAQESGAAELFRNDLPPFIVGMTFLETAISLVLIFLIGLALRNRFRI